MSAKTQDHHPIATVFFTSESRSPVFGYMTGAQSLLFGKGGMNLPQAQTTLSRQQLRALAGTYKFGTTGHVPVALTGASLTVRSKDAGVIRTFTAFPELSAEDRAIVFQIVPQIPDLFKSLHRGDYALLGRSFRTMSC